MDDYTPIPADVLYEAAIRYHRAGHTVLPNDPTRKHPIGIRWQDIQPTEEDIRSWYYDAKIGAIGLRDVEVLDFDNHGTPTAESLLEQWEELVRALSPKTLRHLVYEVTPSGGFHVGWKCHVIAGNQRLATRPTFEEEAGPNSTRLSVTLIETRGKGGQVQVCPSPGYKLIKGDWDNLPNIDANERQILLEAARALTRGDRRLAATFSDPQGRPGDVYNREEGHKAWELLQDAGWSLAYQRDDVMYLRRPGKHVGVSATLGHVAPNVLYVFTTNAEPFQGGKAYTPFAIYAELYHKGNYSTAAATLQKIRLAAQSPAPVNVNPMTGEILEPLPEPPKQEIVSANRLGRMTFDPMQWVVDGLLPEGVTILAGRPKVKKSWLALSISVAVATSGKAFGWFDTRGGTVLYLDLESNQRRMRSRLAQLLGEPDSSAWPENLFIATDWGVGNDCIADLDKFLKDNPNTRLVVIDILARVRPAKSAKMDSYDQDYIFLQALNACADRNRVSILVLHHTRKAKGDDIFEDVSGTTALTGAASTIWVLSRDTNEDDYILSVRGRDVYEEGNIDLRWDEYESRHIYGGITIGSSSSSERATLLRTLEIGRHYSFIDIVQQSGKKKNAVNNLLRRLIDDGVLVKVGRGTYKRRENYDRRTMFTNHTTPETIEPIEVELDEFEVSLVNDTNVTEESYHIAPFGHLWKVWAPYQAQTIHIFDNREKAQQKADEYNRRGGHQ